MAEILARLSADEAWKAWRDLMSLPREKSAKLRWQVMRQIETDKPDLEELGSSDVNCYAVTYLEGRDLIVTDDGWKWCEDFACSCGRNKAGCDHGSTIGTGWAAPAHGDRYP